MEKVKSEEFQISRTKNKVVAFIKTLEIGEVAKIYKTEWERKSTLASGISGEMIRLGMKMSVRTLEDYHLVKRVK